MDRGRDRERPDAGGDPASPAGPLASVVRGEAVRADAAERIRPDPARIAAGWQRRFVIERARLADLVALYERAGFEVAADPVAPELFEDECSDCALAKHLGYVQVYTRRAYGGG